MTLLTAESRQTGLGRYRFRETLSTSFFGPRFRVAYEGTSGHSDAPPAPHAADGGAATELDHTFALRLVEVDAPSLLDKLARAVQALRDVDHVGVVKPLKIVRASTRLGIVTRHVEGVTLAKLLHDASLRQESIAPSLALRILSDVLDGLQVLQHRNHELLGREAVFGGVTPDSIHIGLDGHTRYLDPGLASAAARQPRWSHEAAALAYTAPEQTGAEYTLAAVSDIFSLGVVLWEMLTLRPLFGASTAAETLQRLHQAPIPRVQRQQFVRGEPIAAALAQVVAHALRREHAQRYGSYDEFAIALNAAGTPASRAHVAELVRRTVLALPLEDSHAEHASHPRVRILSGADALDGAEHTGPGLREAANDQASDASGADLDFEPPTTRIAAELPRDAFWPANAAWVPPPAEPEPEPVQKITAFPLGDLLRRPYSGGRDVWSIGAACAAALGLGLVVWTTSGEAPKPRAAAAPQQLQPATDPLEAKPAQALSPPPIAANQPATAEAKPANTNASALADAGANQAQASAAPAATATAPAHTQARPRRPLNADPARASNPATPTPDQTQKQFIPDDI